MYEYGEDYRKHLHQERELRAQDKLEELDKMYMEEIGYYPLLAQREIMKIPLPMSYEDYFMLSGATATAQAKPILQCRNRGRVNFWSGTGRN